MYKYIFKVEYWNDFLSLNATKEITVDCKYFIDAWPKAFEMALTEYGECLEGISFLKVEGVKA